MSRGLLTRVLSILQTVCTDRGRSMRTVDGAWTVDGACGQCHAGGPEEGLRVLLND